MNYLHSDSPTLRKEEQTMQMTVAEYFAGIGLVRLGLEAAGWTVVFANDIDPVKYRLYQNHFLDQEDHFVLGDIHDLAPSEIPQTSLATASFPCTDLSLAGRRVGLKGAQSSAFWGFIDKLEGMGKRKPPFVLLENVTGFLTSHGGKDLEDALKALNDLGYAVDAFIINAAHFVPQSRVRLFIFGKQDQPRIKPQTLVSSELRPVQLTNFINEHPDINWSINHELPSLPIVKHRINNLIEKIPTHSNVWFSKDRRDYLLNQMFDRHLTKIMEQKDKKEYAYYTAFRRVRNGRSMAEVRFDGIAGCLRTPKGGSARQILIQVGKGQINVRLLSPRECARLMGADNYTLTGTANEALFGFGDAVCVPVITWIAENYINPAWKLLTKQYSQKSKRYAVSAS